MKALIEAIFGVYTPITYEVVNADQSISQIIPSGLGGVDWSYVLGVLGFFLVLYCVLRILGSVINKC